MASVRARHIEALCEAQNHRCAYCGIRFGADLRKLGSRWAPPWTAATADHIVPRSQGGSDRWENLVAACRRCNEARACEPALQFFERRGWIASARVRKADRTGWLDRAIRKSEWGWKPRRRPEAGFVLASASPAPRETTRTRSRGEAPALDRADQERKANA